MRGNRGTVGWWDMPTEIEFGRHRDSVVWRDELAEIERGDIEVL